MNEYMEREPNGAGPGDAAPVASASPAPAPEPSAAATPATASPAAAPSVADPLAAPDVVEVVYKGRRREYHSNPREFPVREGDYVVVQAERGEDLGRVHHTNEWVKAEHLTGPIRPILRPARPEDKERLDQNRAKEERAFATCKERIEHRDLEMKLVDCEYQLDGNRVTFFFTAEKRVDFRDLVKDLASIFRTRIELRQIGVRDEAGRIGGVGTCGRELCCATWLREFEPITLKMAKDQGLSPSPSKISGACGRLKCCLRYELDFYKESAREFPKIGSRVALGDVEWEVGRVDIFHRNLFLRDETGNEKALLLEELPPGTRIVGPTRDRRKGCDKTTCGARGARPGDGESAGGQGGESGRRDDARREGGHGGAARGGGPRRGGAPEAGRGGSPDRPRRDEPGRPQAPNGGRRDDPRRDDPRRGDPRRGDPRRPGPPRGSQPPQAPPHGEGPVPPPEDR